MKKVIFAAMMALLSIGALTAQGFLGSPKRFLSNDEIGKIALEHNRGLEFIFLKEVSTKENLKENFLNFESINLSSAIKEDVASKSSMYYSDKFNQYLLANTKLNAFFKISNERISSAWNDKTAFIKAIDYIKSEAEKSLVGTDVDIAILYYEVLGASYIFWKETEEGKGVIITSKMDPRKIIAADGASAAGGFIVGAAVAAASGGILAPASFFGGVLGGTIWGSGCAALGL